MEVAEFEQNPSVQADGALPEILSEFMVDMKCEGCATAVKNSLLGLEGVKTVNVDLNNQVVRVLGSSTVRSLLDALEQTGKNAKLIGQGTPEDFQISAAVAEFKGPEVFGVVRFVQASLRVARIEANFSGLAPGKNSWAIHEFGDLTRGADSTGNIFDPGTLTSPDDDICMENGISLGDLGTLQADANGAAKFSGLKTTLRVADLIGRAVVVRGAAATAAAVIARSASVGQNYKKLCSCDGVTIWGSI
ncbi:copper chaperone for SOD1 isoform X2 [Wolffia australiana]